MEIIEKTIMAITTTVAIGMTTYSIIEKKRNKKLKCELDNKVDEFKTMKIKLAEKRTELILQLNNANDDIKQLEDYKQLIEKDWDKVKKENVTLKSQLDSTDSKYSVEVMKLDKTINEKDRMITDQAGAIISLKVDLDRLRPKEEKKKRPTNPSKKTFQITSIKNLSKDSAMSLWTVTVDSEEDCIKPRISDGYFQILEKGNEKTITLKRAPSQTYSQLRAMVRKCNNITDIFSLHNNIHEVSQVKGA